MIRFAIALLLSTPLNAQSIKIEVVFADNTMVEHLQSGQIVYQEALYNGTWKANIYTKCTFVVYSQYSTDTIYVTPPTDYKAKLHFIMPQENVYLYDDQYVGYSHFRKPQR